MTSTERSFSIHTFQEEGERVVTDSQQPPSSGRLASVGWLRIAVYDLRSSRSKLALIDADLS
ncbi:MAG: hypothetical protein ACP5O0_03265 [Acidimicrobiales bacterium]